MNGTLRTPDQAWQVLLGQLQRDIPKATFDAWVKEARFQSYQAGIFSIAVNSEETRAWLQDRLTSTVARGLAGILDTPVKVLFTLRTSAAGFDSPPADGSPDPASAWEILVRQLLTSLPAGEPAEWLQQASFLAHYEHTVIISLPSVEARAWMAQRLGSSIDHSLRMLLQDETIKAQFVFLPVQNQAVTEPGAVTIPDAGLPAANSTLRPAAPAELSSRQALELRLKPICNSLRDIITSPKSVVVIPAYLLRWLPYLGADQGWLIVALRQAFYQAHGEKVKAGNCGQTFTVNRRRIARWSGLGENSVWQLLNSLNEPDLAGNFLGWFVRSAATGRGKARLYTFRADMPLTPGDVAALQGWLAENNLAEHPIETLQLALSLQPRDLLPYPALPPTPEHFKLPPQPQTIQEVVMAAAGLLRSDSKYRSVKQLADELQNHLQSPSDNLLFSHYFLLEWLEKLGRVAGWIVAILRDRGFIDHTLGIRRDRVVLSDGYRELAQLLSVSERQIRSWLPPLAEMAHQREPTQPQPAEPGTTWARHQAKRSLVKYFLEKDGEVDRSGDRSTTYEFRVKLEDPLTPEHQVIYDALEASLHSAFSSGDWSEVQALAAGLGQADQPSQRETDNSGAARDALDTTLANLAAQNIQPQERSERATDNLRGANQTTGAAFGARNAQLKALMFKYLNPKALKNLQHLLEQHLEDAQSVPAAADAPVSEGGSSHRLEWDWEKLFGYSGAAANTRQEIMQTNTAWRQFLGQAIYGYEQRAAGNGKGIRSPFKYAAARWQDCPPPEYLELAALPPQDLAAVLQDGLRQQAAYAISDAAFRVVKALRAQDFLQVIREATR